MQITIQIPEMPVWYLQFYEEEFIPKTLAFSDIDFTVFTEEEGDKISFTSPYNFRVLAVHGTAKEAKKVKELNKIDDIIRKEIHSAEIRKYISWHKWYIKNIIDECKI